MKKVERYRMYKKGKHWMVALSIGIVLPMTVDSFSNIDTFGYLGLSKVYADSDANGNNTTAKRTVVITPNNFKNSFQANGSAADVPYDASTFTQTLTENVNNQSGNVTLKNKIDLNDDFELTGQINLGDKASNARGADGIGFLLQPGNVDVVGKPGGAAGIGGVPGGFGFKFDTWNNSENTQYFNSDPNPSNFSTHSYGAFVNGTSGKAITDSSQAQTIPDPTNNNFKDFSLIYTAATKTLTVDYAGVKWSRNMSDWIGTNQSMSLAITASTGGGGKNL